MVLHVLNPFRFDIKVVLTNRADELFFLDSSTSSQACRNHRGIMRTRRGEFVRELEMTVWADNVRHIDSHRRKINKLIMQHLSKNNKQFPSITARHYVTFLHNSTLFTN
jgi:hypothetical protein